MRTVRLAAGLLLALGAMAQVPRPAPEFSINLLDGTKVPLKKYQGKIVVLTFISTSCGHCQQFTQVLNGIQREYGSRGVQVLMSAMDEPAKAVLPAYVQRLQPAYPTGWNDGSEVLTFLGVSVMTPGYVPKIAFIDRKGIIREQHFGEDPYFKTQEASVRQSLEQLLKPAGRSTRKARGK